MKNKVTHIQNGIAKFLRTPGNFRHQVVTDKKKQQSKFAARKPVTTTEPTVARKVVGF